jgi:thiol-disulfide isomerase/thioredoxin
MHPFLALILFLFGANNVPAKEAVPFIDDDFAQALLQGKEKNRPIFVETWAPWCHSCRSMRANVFTDKSLERYAGRFVWLSVNTEDSKNAAFLAKHPITSLPTLLILSPSWDKIIMRYIGSTTLAQLEKMLDGVSIKILSEPENLVRSADKFAAAGEHSKAANLYVSAIKSAPKSWRSLGPVSESLLFSLSSAKEYERCSTEALNLYPPIKQTRSGANVAAEGLDCAVSIDEKNPQRSTLIGALEKIAREALSDPKIDLSGDDRSGIYMTLVSGRDALKDEKGAKTLRTEWMEFLEKAAKEARTPEQREVYDSHRLSAYMELGTPENAVPMLEQSERDFPEDYNPPARLAIAYLALKEYSKALAASDRALARAYGPRKIAILSKRADIYLAMADKNTAKKTIGDAIAFARQLPEAQMSKDKIAALEKRLAELSQ